MTRKYMNDRWCVRCGKHDPTPYLRKYEWLLPKDKRALDIGCGNGRNSRFLEALGMKVDSVDMAGDYGMKRMLGSDPLPKRKYGTILANYILMFLNSKERYNVMRDIQDRALPGAVLMIEMYPAKDAHDYDFDKIVGYFEKRGWKRLRRSVDKTILKRIG